METFANATGVLTIKVSRSKGIFQQLTLALPGLSEHEISSCFVN